MASFFVPPGAHNGGGLPLAGAPCPINANHRAPVTPPYLLDAGTEARENGLH